jgi:hypothetical protein
MKNEEIETLKHLAQSWNSLDTRHVKNDLADNLVYESQWVLTPIEGKDDFLRYLESKFQAIKSAYNKQLLIIKAEVAYHPALSDKPIIILTQITLDRIQMASMIIEFDESKIKRIDLCFIPDPLEANPLDN